MNVYHLESKTDISTAADTRPLTWALARMEPESLAVILPGESMAEIQARRDAGRDILAEMLLEFGSEHAEDLALDDYAMGCRARDPFDTVNALAALDYVADFGGFAGMAEALRLVDEMGLGVAA